MNRLQNAQKKLTESLTALESAVKHTQNATLFTAAGNGAGTADVDMCDVPDHGSSSLDTDQLSQDIEVIEADLETAMKMIADLMVPDLSSGRDKDNL